MADALGAKKASAEAARKVGRKAKRQLQKQKQKLRKQQDKQQGHYADPMSPIASTPMKRQRTKAAENSKSTKSKHPLSSGRGDASVPKAKEDEKFFSPRKLVNEYDDEAEKKPKSTRSSPATAATASSPAKKSKESEGELSSSASAGEDANDALFSPTLKPPRSSRSPSSSPSNVRVRLDSAFVSVSSSSSKNVEEEVETTTIENTVATAAKDEEDEDADAAAAEQEFNPFFFMKTLPKYEDIVEGERPISLPERSRNAPKICLVVFNGVEYTVNVKKRPHMEYFLKRVSKLFEIVVFTASHKVYAEKLMNMLDPHRNLIKYVSNGIPIETWYDDEGDAELLNLLPFLESLVDVDDVRPIVEKQFQLQKLIDAAPDEII
ncbi:hypothetical protein BBJ28_00013269 [Nothophytophthora sp. Chile5]|nr:hypothetical protein BBJ28_00013269 [Nothophytophthora sp. Chile5]